MVDDLAGQQLLGAEAGQPLAGVGLKKRAPWTLDLPRRRATETVASPATPSVGLA